MKFKLVKSRIRSTNGTYYWHVYLDNKYLGHTIRINKKWYWRSYQCGILYLDKYHKTRKELLNQLREVIRITSDNV